MCIKLITIKEAREKFGLSKTTFYDRINNGLLPPPISIGGRSVRWIEEEISEVISALVSGKPEKEVKLLVSHLIKCRG
ncbi:transcriptional regulator [Photobacterium rosenbergii]|uniref:Transcriptional regulator n=1 Tax=Photobacterium rosenbergii TaxID=294936 RepID=A0A2T3MYM1_9GAMM|nr:transcriptional regulator [Photobacterium rosenbergii]